MVKKLPLNKSQKKINPQNTGKEHINDFSYLKTQLIHSKNTTFMPKVKTFILFLYLLLILFIMVLYIKITHIKTQSNQHLANFTLHTPIDWSHYLPYEKIALYNNIIFQNQDTNTIPPQNTLDSVFLSATKLNKHTKTLTFVKNILRELNIKGAPSKIIVLKNSVYNNFVIKSNKLSNKAGYVPLLFNSQSKLINMSQNQQLCNLTSSPFLNLTQKLKITFPPSIIKQETEDLPTGKTKIIKQGQPGEAIINISSKICADFINNKPLIKINYTLEKYKAPTQTIMLIGAKPKYRTITIEGQTIRYYRKLNVWATSYDSNCAGCNNTTATGRRLQYGIIAVDPTIIPLHTCMYVPGYGFGQAEDVGGAIKGNKIDLAFEDVRYGWWSARYVDIYLVDCKDAKLPWNK